MKRQYSKPMLSLDFYSLTQTVASCSIKIFRDKNLTVAQRVMADPDATLEMKNLARIGGFIDDACTLSVDYLKTNDGTCYHTNVNGSFSS